ncbi:MAG: hypothetical protein M3445_02870 [Actinomycetota bacterium]|nr:hypothetical protein [Actinomycetota bacterium]
MRIEIRRVSHGTGKAPEVHARVDGIGVSYRVRPGRAGDRAWRCQDPGHYVDPPDYCHHIRAVVSVLDPEVLAGMGMYDDSRRRALS